MLGIGLLALPSCYMQVEKIIALKLLTYFVSIIMIYHPYKQNSLLVLARLWALYTRCFDKENHIQAPSGVHRKPSYKNELNSIINELQKYQVFDIIPGRKHAQLPNLLHSIGCGIIHFSELCYVNIP